ncbi:MAG: efflux RND transporter periplasmic adaptor subunit [Ignavibacteria bacterium]|jgi:cobalt-zinc-cadmium efflux system membrane fusion protein|nr:efflux RND transporter periplasmic adaptor subunit [Ignavibacteria bacterium]MCU7504671.1 efflux RND transporter periplasmic adaptor subunit [Ignavibacteria bacterium]MCU7517521.1 efflux RND transporter periplasmic adaptor subunit [Ignavibacteria bacterium]
MKKMQILSLLAVAGCLILTGCGAKNQEAEKKEEKKSEKEILVTLSKQSIKEINLATYTAEERAITGTITIPAKLVANQDLEAQVGSPVEGRVQKVFVNIGQHVRKGQILMNIEGIEVGEIKANFIKARAEYNYAEANLKRQKTLLEQKAGSQKTFLEAQAEYEKALAELNAEDKRIHSVGLRDADMDVTKEIESHLAGSIPVKSPIDGTVVERNVVIGQHVDAETNAFKIVNSSLLFADGQIYEKDLQMIAGNTPVTFNVSAFPEKQFKGKLIYIGETVESDTRTIKVRASVTNSDKKLKPEMFANMIVPVSGSARGIVVPEESLIRDQGSIYVFVVRNDTTFEKRLVEPGNVMNGFVAIRNGLNKGETVVSKGTFFLKSEMLKGTLEEEE